MSRYNVLKQDMFLPGPVLRDMGASVADKDGLLWVPGNQTISKDGRSVVLSPDAESFRQMRAKQERAFARKPSLAVSGPKGPANAYNRMLARRGLKAMMSRLEKRGLVQKAPALNPKAAPALNRKTAKPQVSLTSTIEKSINFLRTGPEGLESMIGPMARAGANLLTSALPGPVARAVKTTAKLTGPKRGSLSPSFG